jgi:hypothetical protein
MLVSMPLMIPTRFLSPLGAMPYIPLCLLLLCGGSAKFVGRLDATTAFALFGVRSTLPGLFGIPMVHPALFRIRVLGGNPQNGI